MYFLKSCLLSFPSRSASSSSSHLAINNDSYPRGKPRTRHGR